MLSGLFIIRGYMHKFPKHFFHKELMPDGKVIHSAEELEALGKEWVTSPTEFEDTKPAGARRRRNKAKSAKGKKDRIHHKRMN
jgi:hypothetical protein